MTPLRYLVLGGRVSDPQLFVFDEPASVEKIGAFRDYGDAYDAWRGASMRRIDEADYKVVVYEFKRVGVDHRGRPTYTHVALEKA